MMAGSGSLRSIEFGPNLGCRGVAEMPHLTASLEMLYYRNTNTQEHSMNNRDELIHQVLMQIGSDVRLGDMTAIEELLRAVPDADLIAYLPEEQSV